MLAPLHVRQATVQAVAQFGGSATWKHGKPVSQSRWRGSGRLVVFFAPGHAPIFESGAWNGRTVTAWTRLLHAPTAGGSGNACVDADGAVHRVGRFDAAARC